MDINSKLDTKQSSAAIRLAENISEGYLSEKAMASRTLSIFTEEMVNLSDEMPTTSTTTFEEMENFMKQAEFFRHFSENTAFMSQMLPFSIGLAKEEEIELLCHFFHGEKDWKTFLHKYFLDVSKTLQEICLLVLITGKIHRFKFVSEIDFCRMVEFLVKFLQHNTPYSRELIHCVRYGNFNCFLKDFSFNPYKKVQKSHCY